jgi:hypothetical protein
MSSSELLIRSPAADLYARALVMAYRSGIRIYDPSLAQAREPDIEAKLLRDADIAMAVKLRQHMIAGNDWYIEPATEDPVNQQAAEVMTALCERIRGFTQSRHNLSRAFVSGQRFATMEGTELDLPIGDGQPRTWNAVLRLRDHDKRRFRWVPNSDTGDGVGVTTHLEVLSTRTGDWIDVQHPEWLIKHTYDDSEEMLGYGRGLRESLYWWWYAKEHIFRESLQAAERFGQGIITAQIDGAKDANGMPNTELVTAWKNALEAMRSEHVLIYDKDDDVSVVNMTGQGWQLLSTMREELRTTIRTLILGASMTTNNEGGAGSHGLAEVQSESTQSLVRYDRETLEETLTEDLIGYLWRANFHNLVAMGLGSAEMPRFKIKQEKAQDPERFGRVVALALQSQIPLKAEEVYDGLGLSQPKQGDEIIEPPQQSPDMGGGFPGAPGGPGGQPGGPQPPGGGQDGPDSLVPDFEVPEMNFLPDLAAQRPRGGITVFEGPRGAKWDEAKHPRDDDGKFKGSGSGSGRRRRVDPTEGVGREAGAHRPAPPLDAFPASVSTLTRKSARMGSNPGGVYEDEDTGERFYVKKPRSDGHARNEVLAARLYDLAGIDVAEVETIDFEGQLGVASRWRKVEQRSARTVAKAPGSAEGFAVDAWLMNWDAAGLGTDNLVLDPETGGAIRIDTGGALLFRAQGARKSPENLSAEVQELETMRQRGSASKVFGHMSDQEILGGVERIIAINDDDIRDTCEQHYPEEAPFLSDLLIARKNWLRGWYEAELFMRRCITQFEQSPLDLTLFKAPQMTTSEWIMERVKGGPGGAAMGPSEHAADYAKVFGVSSIAARKRVNQAFAGLRAKAAAMTSDLHGNAGQVGATLNSKGIPAGIIAGALVNGFGLNPVEAGNVAAYISNTPGSPTTAPAAAKAAKGQAPGTTLPDASKGPLKFAKAYLSENPDASPEEVGQKFKAAGGGSPLGWATQQAAKVKQDLDINGPAAVQQSPEQLKQDASNVGLSQAVQDLIADNPDLDSGQIADLAEATLDTEASKDDLTDMAAMYGAAQPKPAAKKETSSESSSGSSEQSGGGMVTGSSGQKHCPAGTEKGGQFAPKDGDCGAALTSKEQQGNVTKAEQALAKAKAKLQSLKGEQPKGQSLSESDANLKKAKTVFPVGQDVVVTGGSNNLPAGFEGTIAEISPTGKGRKIVGTGKDEGKEGFVHYSNLETKPEPPKKGDEDEIKAATNAVKDAEASLKAEQGLLGDVIAGEQKEALGGFDPLQVLGVGTIGDTSFNKEAAKAKTQEELDKINAEAKAKREAFLQAKKEAKFVGTFEPPDAQGPPENWPDWEYDPAHPGDKSKAIRGAGWNRGDWVRIKDQNGEFRDVRCVFPYGKKVKADGSPPNKALCIDPKTKEKFSVTSQGVVAWIKTDESKVATGKRTGAKKKMHQAKAAQLEAEKRAIEAASKSDEDEGHFGGGASLVAPGEGEMDSRTALKSVLGEGAGVTARLAAVAQTLRAKRTDPKLKGTQGIPMPALAKSNFTHKDALRTYTGGSYRSINGALRGRGSSAGKNNTTARNCVKGYENGRTQFGKDGITVYRGSGTNGLARSLGIPLEGLSSDRAAAAMQILAHAGARMKLDGMVSTSTHVNGSTSWGAGQTALIFEIDTPEGVPAQHFSQHPGEREVILAHGQEYSIKGVRWAPGISRWVVNLQAHPETRVTPDQMGPSYFKDKKAEFDAATKATMNQ